MSSRCTCSVCGSDLTTQNGLWGCHACFPAVPANEVERLRAEANRYLQEREDALTELKPLQGQLLIQAAVRRLG